MKDFFREKQGITEREKEKKHKKNKNIDWGSLLFFGLSRRQQKNDASLCK